MSSEIKANIEKTLNIIREEFQEKQVEIPSFDLSGQLKKQLFGKIIASNPKNYYHW